MTSSVRTTSEVIVEGLTGTAAGRGRGVAEQPLAPAWRRWRDHLAGAAATGAVTFPDHPLSAATLDVSRRAQNRVTEEGRGGRGCRRCAACITA